MVRWSSVVGISFAITAVDTLLEALVACDSHITARLGGADGGGALRERLRRSVLADNVQPNPPVGGGSHNNRKERVSAKL